MMMRTTTTLVRRKKQRARRPETSQREPEQLFRFKGSTVEAQRLLEREHLTEEDIRRFCAGETTTDDDETEQQLESPTNTTTATTTQQQQAAYRARRKELFDLNRKLRLGRGARIDDNGRLVSVPHPPPPPPAMDLPLPPPRQQQQQQQQQQFAAPLIADHPAAAVAAAVAADEEDEQWLVQQEQAAAAAIARAIERYREQGVPEQDLQLIRPNATAAIVGVAIGPNNNNNNNNMLIIRSLTFRRICIAVLAVLTAFLLIMIKTLPLFQTTSVTTMSETFDPTMDKLVMELLHVKTLMEHINECPGLHRKNEMKWYDPVWRVVTRRSKNHSAVDCSDGVLHIPSKKVLDSLVRSGAFDKEFAKLQPLVTAIGVNVSWFFPCHEPNSNTPATSLYSLAPSQPRTCAATTTTAAAAAGREESSKSMPGCFRGVHDNLLTERELRDIVQLGGVLISEGGDHFDIQQDISLLRKHLPSVIAKLSTLFAEQYGVSKDLLSPVAFRIGAVGPIDAANVPLYGIRAASGLVRLLNRTNYIEWVENAQRRNEIAQFSLPWPFRIKPVRDVCNLMADMEADPSFLIQTTVFLSGGAGDDFKGGGALYVDHHASNNNPRKKIRRGITVDGSRGRVVVSTGGLENRRCRLPTRAGIRAASQIWWSFT